MPTIPFDRLEAGLKIMRLVDSMNPAEIAVVAADCLKVLTYIAGSARGATVAAVVMYYNHDERYAQSLINTLKRGRLIEERGNGFYTLSV